LPHIALSLDAVALLAAEGIIIKRKALFYCSHGWSVLPRWS
jgi:hypothetical protein